MRSILEKILDDIDRRLLKSKINTVDYYEIKRLILELHEAHLRDRQLLLNENEQLKEAAMSYMSYCMFECFSNDAREILDKLDENQIHFDKFLEGLSKTEILALEQAMIIISTIANTYQYDVVNYIIKNRKDLLNE